MASMAYTPVIELIMCFIIMLAKGSRACVIVQLRISVVGGVADFACIE